MMSSTGTIRLENTDKGVYEGTCTCNCGGGSGGPGDNCPHPSYPFIGKAMADFTKTERCVAVTKTIGGSGDPEDGWTETTFPGLPSAESGEVAHLKISPQENWAAVYTWALGENPARIRLYKKTGGNWVLHTTFIDSYIGTGVYMEFSHNEEWFVFLNRQSGGQATHVERHRLENDEWVKKDDISIAGYNMWYNLFSPDGRWFVNTTQQVNGSGGQVRFYEVEGENWTLKQTHALQENYGPANFTQDSSYCIVGGSISNTQVGAYRLTDGQWVAEPVPKISGRSVYSATVSADGQYVAVGYIYQRIEDKKLYCYKRQGSNWAALPIDEDLIGLDALRVCFSPDASLLAVAASIPVNQMGQNLHIYSVGENGLTKLEAPQFDTKGLWHLQFIENGTCFICSTGGALAPVRYWAFYLPGYGPGTTVQNELHPYTTARAAVNMEGYVGHGFTQEAYALGQDGTADIMFE